MGWVGLGRVGREGKGYTKSAKLNHNRYFKISAFLNLWIQSEFVFLQLSNHILKHEYNIKGYLWTNC